MPKIKPLPAMQMAVSMSIRDNYFARRYRQQQEARKLLLKALRHDVKALCAAVQSIGGPRKTSRRKRRA